MIDLPFGYDDYVTVRCDKCGGLLGFFPQRVMCLHPCKCGNDDWGSPRDWAQSRFGTFTYVSTEKWLFSSCYEHAKGGATTVSHEHIQSHVRDTKLREQQPTTKAARRKQVLDRMAGALFDICYKVTQGEAWAVSSWEEMDEDTRESWRDDARCILHDLRDPDGLPMLLIRDVDQPCIDCGKLRTEADSGVTFTVHDECWVCDECWDRHRRDKREKSR